MTKICKILQLFVFVFFGVFESHVSAQLTVDENALDSISLFRNNPVARRTLLTALADVNAVIGQNLGAITANEASIQRSLGNATVSFDLTATVRNPSVDSLDPFSLSVSPVVGRSEIPLFVGVRSFDSGGNPCGLVGNGGTAMQFVSFNLPRFTFASPLVRDDFNDLVRSAVDATTAYRRGDGPVLFAQRGSLLDVEFEIEVGLISGFVSFNNKSNFYHFDHTTAPPPDLFDFYSAVLHESLHALTMGIEGVSSWDRLAAGANWTGSEVVRLRGNGAGVIDTSGGSGQHILPSVANLSPRITDGVLQESALVRTLRRGARHELTELDLAFLRDLGFSGAVVPPRRFLMGDFDRDGEVDLADLDQYNGNVPSNANDELPAIGVRYQLDLDGSGSVQQVDFRKHYTTLVRTSNGRVGALAGDANLDGRVDVLGDGFVLVMNLGGLAINSWSQGDFNADRTVDVLGDGFVLISNLGRTNN